MFKNIKVNIHLWLKNKKKKYLISVDVKEKIFFSYFLLIFDISLVMIKMKERKKVLNKRRLFFKLKSTMRIIKVLQIKMTELMYVCTFIIVIFVN